VVIAAREREVDGGIPAVVAYHLSDSIPEVIPLKRLIWLFLAVALAAAACSSGGPLVATVDGEDVRLSEVEALFAGEPDTVGSDMFAGYLQTLIVHKLVVSGAEELGVTIGEDDINAKLEEIRTQVEASGQELEAAAAAQGFSMDAVTMIAEEQAIQEQVGATLVADAPAPTDDEIQAAYNAGLQSYATVCASHILVETEEEAIAARERLDAGEAFADVATEISLDTGSAANGGDLGCAVAATYVPEFALAAIDAEIGVPTDPVQSQFGYHVILVDEREVLTLDDVRIEILAQIAQQQEVEVLNEWVLDLVTNADVTVEEEYGSWESSPTGPGVVPPAT
jgi:foldase protein PrsA